MTKKELLYLEDAVDHETNIISILEESIDMLEDENLVEFLENELDNHTSMKEKLINLLEEKVNE